MEEICHDDICGITVPPGCNPDDDVKNQPRCVVSSFGIFVDATNGDDANAGTKEAPFRSIGHALGTLGGKSRVYVCGGTYAEHVVVSAPASVFGGFACGTWSFDGSRPKLAPDDDGPGLVVSPVASPMTFADLDVVARNASAPARSSIAIFVKSDVTSLTLRRVSATAGDAFATASAPPLSSATVAGATAGNTARGTTGGLTKTCDCASSGQSVGGRGGDGAASGTAAMDGARGAGSPSSPPSGSSDAHPGVGATSGGAACTTGGRGPNGSAGIGGAGARILGTLSDEGWSASAGTDGETGRPGVGGGGGGGGNQSGGAGGGSGACGGCGGGGGAGGSGGGSSIAVVVGARSVLVLEQSTLVAGGAQPGTPGGQGGGAIAGGVGAPAATGACAGGNGGDGAGGSGGGGGAGGSSIGILYAGPPPTVDAGSMVSTAPRGAAGGQGGLAGGAAASGVPGAAGSGGIAGVAEALHALAPSTH